MQIRKEETMKTIWEIEIAAQKLRSGSWDDECPDWDWEITHERYDTLKQAMKRFNALKVDSDIPQITLSEVLLNKYGQREYERPLKRKIAMDGDVDWILDPDEF